MTIREMSRVKPTEFSIIQENALGVVGEIKYLVGKGEDSSLERVTVYKSGRDVGWHHFGTGNRIRQELENYADAQYFKIRMKRRAE